jgi:hypothetical protein
LAKNRFIQDAQVQEAIGNQTKAEEIYKEVADFNQLNALIYAFVRTDAQAI